MLLMYQPERFMPPDPMMMAVEELEHCSDKLQYRRSMSQFSAFIERGVKHLGQSMRCQSPLLGIEDSNVGN